jgi:hypothetical protein
MGNKIDNRIAYLNGLYQGIWLGIPNELISIGRFKTDLHFKMGMNELIEADRIIYNQIKTCKKLNNPRNVLYRQFATLEKALKEVHKGIFTILQTDYRIDSCWVNDEDELDYLRI